MGEAANHERVDEIKGVRKVDKEERKLYMALGVGILDPHPDTALTMNKSHCF